MNAMGAGQCNKPVNYRNALYVFIYSRNSPTGIDIKPRNNKPSPSITPKQNNDSVASHAVVFTQACYPSDAIELQRREYLNPLLYDITTRAIYIVGIEILCIYTVVRHSATSRVVINIRPQNF